MVTYLFVLFYGQSKDGSTIFMYYCEVDKTADQYKWNAVCLLDKTWNIKMTSCHFYLEKIIGEICGQKEKYALPIYRFGENFYVTRNFV